MGVDDEGRDLRTRLWADAVQGLQNIQGQVHVGRCNEFPVIFHDRLVPRGRAWAFCENVRPLKILFHFVQPLRQDWDDSFGNRAYSLQRAKRGDVQQDGESQLGPVLRAGPD